MSDRNPADLPGDFEGEDQGGVATAEGSEEQVAENAVPLGDLTVAAPTGSHWDWSEVKTARGTKSLGQIPILVWDDPQAALEFYGPEAFLSGFNNTGLRVPFQGIGRRGRAGGKMDANAIAQEQLEYKPGQTERAAPTATSRAKSAAARAAEQLGEGADLITTLLNKVANKEITEEQLSAILGGQRG